jgi:hypothetical protein
VESLYKAYKDKAQFFIVYIREAHPEPEKTRASEDQRKAHARRYGDLGITQPKTLQQRAEAARKCMKGMKLTMPILLDPIEGDYVKAYGGWPAGTTVIDIEGRIAYWNRGEPRGAKPKEAEAALKKIVDAGAAAVADKWKPVKYPRAKPEKAAPKKAEPKEKK